MRLREKPDAKVDAGLESLGVRGRVVREAALVALDLPGDDARPQLVAERPRGLPQQVVLREVTSSQPSFLMRSATACWRRGRRPRPPPRHHGRLAPEQLAHAIDHVPRPHAGTQEQQPGPDHRHSAGHHRPRRDDGGRGGGRLVGLSERIRTGGRRHRGLLLREQGRLGDRLAGVPAHRGPPRGDRRGSGAGRWGALGGDLRRCGGGLHRPRGSGGAATSTGPGAGSGIATAGAPQPSPTAMPLNRKR